MEHEEFIISSDAEEQEELQATTVEYWERASASMRANLASLKPIMVSANAEAKGSLHTTNVDRSPPRKRIKLSPSTSNLSGRYFSPVNDPETILLPTASSSYIATKSVLQEAPPHPCASPSEVINALLFHAPSPSTKLSGPLFSPTSPLSSPAMLPLIEAMSPTTRSDKLLSVRKHRSHDDLRLPSMHDNQLRPEHKPKDPPLSPPYSHTPSIGPLALFTPLRSQAENSGRVLSRQESPNSVVMSSPLTPLHSPRPTTVSPRTNLHSPSDKHADRRPSGLPDLQDEQLLARYSLRTRKAKQVNPYEYDKMLYKRQMRANPDAIVKIVSPPQRKHRERSGERMRDSDAEVDPQDLDLDRSDDDRPIRQRSKSAGIKAAEAHPPGPGDRSSMHSGGNSWYPSAFNDSSSSEEGEIVPVTRNAPPGRERQPKRRRKRRFPMAREVLQAGPHINKTPETTRTSLPRSPPRRPSSKSPSMSPNDDTRDMEHSTSPLRILSSPEALPPASSHVSSSDRDVDADEGFVSDYHLAENPQEHEHTAHSDPDDAHGITRWDPIPISDDELDTVDNYISRGEYSTDSDEEPDPGMLKAQILYRMYPKRLADQYLRESDAKRATRKVPVRGIDDQPLQPGQSRIRKRIDSRVDIEIRGDSESSDIEMVETLNRPGRSLSPVHAVISSGSESDGRGYAPATRVFTPDSDSEDGGVHDGVDDEEVELWVREARQHPRRGQAEEGSLIDYMLSKTSGTGPKRKRSRAHHASRQGARRPRMSAVGNHIVTSGARASGSRHQTLLQFSRVQSASFRPLTRVSSTQNVRQSSTEKENHDIEDLQEDHHQQLGPLSTKAKDIRKKGNTGVYVFEAKRKHIATGRAHPHAFTVDVEDEDIPNHQTHSPRRRRKQSSPAARKSRRFVPSRQSANVDEPVLEDFWNQTEPVEEIQPMGPIPAEAHLPSGREILDSGVSVLPSGIAFGQDTYCGRGCLQDLLSAPSSYLDMPPPAPGYIQQKAFSTETPLAVFLDMVDTELTSLLALLSDNSRIFAVEEYHQWCRTLNAICRHVTWFRGHCSSESIGALRNLVDKILSRTFSIVQTQFAVRSDFGYANCLLLEIQWYGIELSYRLGDKPNFEAGTPENIVTHLKLFIRRLLAFDFKTVLNAVTSLGGAGIDYSVPSHRIGELWICLIHITVEQERPSLFGDLLLQVIQGSDLLRLVPSVEASEFMWRIIYGFCALSQFSAHGMTTSAPRLRPSWKLVEFTLQRVRLARQENDRDLLPAALLKRDVYVRLLVCRCMLLHQKWQWHLKDASVMFSCLLKIFTSRRFANLMDEAADFPKFMRDNDLQRLSEQKGTAFTLFLKLVVLAAKESSSEGEDGVVRALPASVRKILSLAVPVGSIPFKKAVEATPQEFSMLYNRFSAIAVAIYLEPTVSNLNNRLLQMRRYVNLKEIDHMTQRACIRGVMHISILLQHLGLPLEGILEWLSEMSNNLIAKYREYGLPRKISSSVKLNNEENRVIVCIQLILGCIRQILKTPHMDSRITSARYPNPALLDGPWVKQIYSSEMKFAASRSTGVEMRRLLRSFLDARSLIIPRPSLPRAAPANNGESQESQDDYGQFDIDLDDPELAAALGDEIESSSRQQLKPMEEATCRIMDADIVPALSYLVCKEYHELGGKAITMNADDLDEWIECWAGCAGVLVHNRRRDWSRYAGLGMESWERISDSTLRRKVGVRFSLAVLQVDPGAYAHDTHRDLFLKVLVQSMATLRSKAEAEYVATVFSIDRSQHCLLHDIPWNPTNAAEKKTLSAAEFLDNRIVYLRCIFRNLAQSLRREVEGDTSLTADNQKYLGWLSTMVSVMQDIHQNATGVEKGLYDEFCRGVCQLFSEYPMLKDSDRLQQATLWLNSTFN